MNRTLNILFIDDSWDDVDLARLELKRQDMASECRRVATHGELEEVLHERRWDVILCDCRMPGLDAIEAWSLCNARQPGSAFVVFSGLVFGDELVALLDAGVRHFIDKNRMSELAPKLQKLLRAKPGSDEARNSG